MTTDTRARSAVVDRDGFTVGGMAKGSGMIHPDLATMLAVVTTDYPLAPGEAIGFLRPAVEDELQRDLGRRRLLDERRRLLLANGASGVERTPRPTKRSPPRCTRSARDLARQIVADGEGITVARRDQRHRRRRRRPGQGDRAPDRHLAARQDRALRPRRQLGPGADGRRLARRTTAATRSVDAARVTLRYNGTVVLDARRAERRRARRLRADAARSSSTSASATAGAAT